MQTVLPKMHLGLRSEGTVHYLDVVIVQLKSNVWPYCTRFAPGTDFKNKKITQNRNLTKENIANEII